MACWVITSRCQNGRVTQWFAKVTISMQLYSIVQEFMLMIGSPSGPSSKYNLPYDPSQKPNSKVMTDSTMTQNQARIFSRNGPTNQIKEATIISPFQASLLSIFPFHPDSCTY